MPVCTGYTWKAHLHPGILQQSSGFVRSFNAKPIYVSILGSISKCYSVGSLHMFITVSFSPKSRRYYVWKVVVTFYSHSLCQKKLGIMSLQETKLLTRILATKVCCPV